MSILIKPAYDADASAYFTTAGVTNTAGRQQISRFVTGIKDLGLYNNMVCWPLRSSQNAGTGTTAYSLGGLGTFNGTLTNGPTWGVDGVTFNNASAQYISTSCAYNPATLSTGFLSVINQTETPNFANAREICGNRSVAASSLFKNTNGFQDITLFDSAGDHNNAQVTSRISYVSGRQFAGGFVDSATREFFNQLNAATATANSVGGTITSGSSNFQIARGGVYSTTRTFTGEISFVGLLRQGTITAANIEACRTLYKNTLGQGLGLP
jgi:hypothetical protein